ncbi:hypothetical protein HYE54_06575 [Aggregatibacter actinomycetemcomitans]|uniref:hypothetical protein n=1 Tax=Aggregatibacter actinomycetemcomitans TaxID=714 RepID=UPI00197BB652|nr:hypothetical protein [Aggregatibacter actinomycetemcomitans]MBN6068425.1 hypothetical protein [Aggregatibacter actinomycetemcomitans]MBN6085057.1 hypothetical protein [Aggregatibacter actinomycetemcomitans]
MSRISKASWEIQREREIRGQARRAREQQVRETTEVYLRRHEEDLRQLEKEDLAEFAAQSIANIRQMIRQARLENAYDGRERSFAIGRTVQFLRREALENKRIAEEHQRLLREEATREAERLKAEYETAWQQAIGSWADKLARNLAFKPLAELRKRIADENLSITQMQSAVEEIRQATEKKAEAIRQDFKQSVQQDIVAEQKETLLKTISTANLPQAQSERLKQKVEQADSTVLSQISQEIHQVEDKVVEDEAVRKEMVKAVYQSLKQAGFTVLPPVKQGDGDDSIVLIQASRPQGNQAKFRVNLNGSVRYEFDNYKGQRCKEDMQKVLPKLSEVYGVNLSDERVIWSNPDDETADAKPIAPIHTAKSR